MATQKLTSDQGRKPSRAFQKPQRETAPSLSPALELNPLLLQRAIEDPAAASPGDILSLQQASGNQAVSQLIQAKLTVGPVGDSYEQEADRVADQVMAMREPTSFGPVQRQEDEEELQMKPLAAAITPVVQRQEDEEEDLIQMEPLAQRQELDEEELQMKPLVQRQENEEEDLIQMEPLAQRQELDEEELQMKPLIQRQEDEEEDLIQMKPLVQRQELDEEELQMKPIVQRAADDGSFEAGSDVERTLASRQGSGSPLSDDVRSFMEPRFGTDFSGVRIHSDGQAGELSQTLQAKAFTHGQDIYFGAGQYSPGTGAGKRLLAHELTHVVQQAGGGGKIQRWGTYKGGTSHEIVTEEAFQGVEGYSQQAKEYLINMSEAMDARGGFWAGMIAGMIKQRFSKIKTDPNAYDNLIGYWRPKDEAPNHGEGGQYMADGTSEDIARVNSLVDRAKNAWDSNDTTQALTMIGLALHAAEDRGAHGDGRPGEGHDPRRSIRPPEGAKITHYFTEGWDNTDCDKRSKNPEGYQRGVQYGRDVLTSFRDYVAEKQQSETLEKFDKENMGHRRRWRKFVNWWDLGKAKKERESDKPIYQLSPEERIAKMMNVEELGKQEALTLDLYILHNAATGDLTPEERIAVVRKGRPLPITSVLNYLKENIETITPRERIALIETGQGDPELLEYLRTNAATLAQEERDAILRNQKLMEQLGPQYTENLAKMEDGLLPGEKAALTQEDWEARGKMIASDPKLLEKEKSKGKLQWWIDEEKTPTTETSLAGIRQILEQLTGKKGTTTDEQSKEESLAGIQEALGRLLPGKKGTEETTTKEESEPGNTIWLYFDRGAKHYQWLKPLGLTIPDDYQNQGILMRQLISPPHYFDKIDKGGGGDCQYLSISAGLDSINKGKPSVTELRETAYNTIKNSPEMRNLLAAKIADMRSESNSAGVPKAVWNMIQALRKDPSPSSPILTVYLNAIKDGRMWGDDITIGALAEAYKVSIEFLQKENVARVENEER
jgi:hypothetical protein